MLLCHLSGRAALVMIFCAIFTNNWALDSLNIYLHTIFRCSGQDLSRVQNHCLLNHLRLYSQQVALEPLAKEILFAYPYGNSLLKTEPPAVR